MIFPCCECCQKHKMQHFRPCPIHQSVENWADPPSYNYEKKKAKKYPVPEISLKLAEAGQVDESRIESYSRLIRRALE